MYDLVDMGAYEYAIPNEPPAFDVQEYNFSLSASSVITTGELVGTVNATDPSSTDQLSYSILSGDPDNLFSIDPSTGEISVKDASLLPPGTSISLVVQVQDSGMNSLWPPMTATTTVNVNIPKRWNLLIENNGLGESWLDTQNWIQNRAPSDLMECHVDPSHPDSNGASLLRAPDSAVSVIFAADLLNIQTDGILRIEGSTPELRIEDLRIDGGWIDCQSLNESVSLKGNLTLSGKGVYFRNAAKTLRVDAKIQNPASAGTPSAIVIDDQEEDNGIFIFTNPDNTWSGDIYLYDSTLRFEYDLSCGKLYISGSSDSDMDALTVGFPIFDLAGRQHVFKQAIINNTVIAPGVYTAEELALANVIDSQGGGTFTILDTGLVQTENGLIQIPFTRIGNPGNPAHDEPLDYVSPPEQRGSVDYEFDIAVYETTTAQINQMMAPDPTHLPISSVTLRAAMRYCNQLTSGDPLKGVYAFDAEGLFTGVDRITALKAYGIIYALPTKDEWWKACRYTAQTYSLYANGTDVAPVSGVDANYFSVNLWSVGSGTLEQNGTYNMNGNVAELIEPDPSGTFLKLGGANWHEPHLLMDYYPQAYAVAAFLDRDLQNGLRIVCLSDSSFTGFTAKGTPWSWLERQNLVQACDYERADLNDRDNDGSSNHFEYIVGTDPHDRASVLNLEMRQSATTDSLDLHWEGVPGRLYQVEWSDQLQEGAFQALGSEQEHDANHYNIPYTPENRYDNRFYRLRVRLKD